MAFIDDTIVNNYITALINKRLNDKFVKVKPLTSWLAGSATTKLDKLGDPQIGMFFGGRADMEGRRAVQSGAPIYKSRYKKEQVDAATTLTSSGNIATASKFVEDLRGTTQYAWHMFNESVRIRESTIENIMGAGYSEHVGNQQIASVIEEAADEQIQVMLDKLQSLLWTGTLTSGQQAAITNDDQEWSSILGLTHLVSDGTSTGETTYNYIDGVDRTTETILKANVVLGSQLTATVPTLRLIRQSRLLQTGGASDAATFGAMRKRQADAGKLVVTTPELWEVLANEADSKNQINSNDVQNFARSGFNQPLIRLDDSYIAWDHDCPSGQLYVLTPETFCFQTQKGNNFRPGPWVKKHETEEGTQRYRWNNIYTKCRLACERPDLNLKFTSLTTS